MRGMTMYVRYGEKKRTKPQLDAHQLGLLSGIIPVLVAGLSDLLPNPAAWGL